jgi:hypothetical protein
MSLRIMGIALLLALVAGSAPAQTVGGVKLADSVNVSGNTLVLNGAGVRSKLWIKVYVGALYLPTKQTTAQVVLGSDTPRRMVMHFVYDVGKEKLVEAWQQGLADNTPNASAEVKSAFATLESWMEDIDKGQEIVLTYVPGTGTTVELNGKTKGTLKGGKPVADAILSTWIGPKPGPGEDFKNAILGH